MAEPQRRERLTESMRTFLAAYEGNLNIAAACRIANISRKKFYSWKAKSAKFSEALEHAYENGVERIEREAYRRAVEGVAKKRFSARGEPILDPETGKPYVEYQYSDKLLVTLLRRYRPDDYAAFSHLGIYPGHTRNAQPGPSAAEVVREMHKDPQLVDAIRLQSMTDDSTLPPDTDLDEPDFNLTSEPTTKRYVREEP